MLRFVIYSIKIIKLILFDIGSKQHDIHWMDIPLIKHFLPSLILQELFFVFLQDWEVLTLHVGVCPSWLQSAVSAVKQRVHTLFSCYIQVQVVREEDIVALHLSTKPLKHRLCTEIKTQFVPNPYVHSLAILSCFICGYYCPFDPANVIFDWRR